MPNLWIKTSTRNSNQGVNEVMVMTVKLTMKDGTVVMLPHITEIHYNYPTVEGLERIAFESDILMEGYTYTIEDVHEFEAFSERKAYVDNITDMNILILKEMGIDIHQYLKYALKVVEDVTRATNETSEMDT